MSTQTLIRASNLEVWPAERFVGVLALFLVTFSLFQIALRGIAVDWGGYAFIGFAGISTFAAGQYYRLSNRSARIGASLTCTGLFAVFSSVTVVFNYLMMPTARPPIDQTLVWLDSLVGYHWPDVIAWMAQNPTASMVIKIAYMTTIPQIACLIIVLGMTGRIRQLHVMMVSIAITSIIAVCFWGLFPSHGAKSLFTLPQSLEVLADPVVTTQYGRDLVRMAQEGPGLIAPDEVKGLIAFPSYHAVLAFTAVYSMRGVRFFFPRYVVLNLLILPGAPMHGGHHLIDIPAGLVLFIFGTIVAERLVAAMYRDTGAGSHLPVDMTPVAAKR